MSCCHPLKVCERVLVHAFGIRWCTVHIKKAARLVTFIGSNLRACTCVGVGGTGGVIRLIWKLLFLADTVVALDVKALWHQCRLPALRQNQFCPSKMPRLLKGGMTKQVLWIGPGCSHSLAARLNSMTNSK